MLLSADDIGTVEIMRRTGTSKTSVWRWQKRFAEAGVGGLLRDKTRPSRVPPLGRECEAKALEAKSLRPAAVERALLVNLLNTRLAAAKGVSSPALAGASWLTSRLGTSSGAGSSISLPRFRQR